MSDIKAHIIIIDGKPNIGRKMFSLELALVLAYNNQKTAIVLPPDSKLRQTLSQRKQQFPHLPQIEIIAREDFKANANDYNAIIIPTSANDELALTANTLITMIPQTKKSTAAFNQDKAYLNALWKLKKKIAASCGRSLDWVVCENNLKDKNTDAPSAELTKAAKLYGFRVCPPLNRRKAYTANASGISAQDKTTPELKKELTYDDICAKREIIRLAEFIFS